jgi:hypothetical protein
LGDLKKKKMISQVRPNHNHLHLNRSRATPTRATWQTK